MKVMLVVGARPNFVKAAPILAAMRPYPELQPRLIHTGQHYDGRMSGSFFEELDIPKPDVNLQVGSGAAVVQIAEIVLRLVRVLTDERPDLVAVVGDVNSTIAGALAAAKMDIPVAHVEAGLRSFDRTMPEEINRLVTDALSTYCFTTEPSAGENLLREGVAPARIHHVGNVMIDTLFRFRERASRSSVLDDHRLVPRAYAVLTLHRPSNVDDRARLATVLAACDEVGRDVPIVFPVHPRTRATLADGLVRDGSGLRVVEPLGYLDFVQLMANAAVVLTDSGGIQEETTALGVPCLTLRSNTERPITVETGTNRLVGCDAAAVARAWDEIRRGKWPAGRLPELWDGKAAERIVKIILDRPGA